MSTRIAPAEIESQLNLWPGLAGGSAKLINLSENHTFRIDMPDGAHHILRVHRPGYHTRAAIESELNWLAALRADTDLETVCPLPGQNGALVQHLTNTNGAAFFAVRFKFEPGREAVESDGEAGLFTKLGTLAAICHAHVERWTLPTGFQRLQWTTDTILAPDGLWGNWRLAPGVDAPIREILDRVDVALTERFKAYGSGRDRFGLIHADMRLANLLIHDSRVRLIDFDDCGLGWFVYDFAAAVSFFEHQPHVADLKQHWVEGYRQKRALTAEDEAMLDAAVMLRRMALLAWTGSHAETELAQSQHTHFAKNSAILADRWLSATHS